MQYTDREGVAEDSPQRVRYFSPYNRSIDELIRFLGDRVAGLEKEFAMARENETENPEGVTLRELIEVALQAYASRKIACLWEDEAQVTADFASDAEGLLKRVLVEGLAARESLDGNDRPINDGAIKVGDRVRVRGSGRYLGEVTKIETRAVIKDQTKVNVMLVEDIEVAPKLTPDNAWVEATLAISGAIAGVHITGRLSEFEQREIRHQAYVILGGTGIKITESVKEQVRSIIRRVAEQLDVRLA